MVGQREISAPSTFYLILWGFFMRYIVYHNADLDGLCSAAIVYLYLRRTTEPSDIGFIGIDYPDKFPMDRINPDDSIYMVDFSLSVQEMEYLANKVSIFHWIDHHKTALDKSIGTSFEMLPGIRQIGRAGCELCWDFYFPNKELPRVVFLLGRYDVWDHKDPDILPFQMGLKLRELDIGKDIFSIELWKRLIYLMPGYETEDIVYRTQIVNGKNILKYREKANEAYLEKCGYEIEFEGMNALVVNRLLINSKFFDSKFDPKKHDLMISYGFLGHTWKVSLYTSKDIDLSQIAVKYGGGGHPQACGFHTDDISFLLPKK